MRAVIQRVTHASVSIEGSVAGAIDQGFLILLGVGANDTEEIAEKLWAKIAKMRIFADAAGKTNLALGDVAGQVLIVSQFTLYADCRHGNRPSFTSAGAPAESKRLYEYFVSLAERDIEVVQTGEFGADMQVALENDGPFTIVLDTDTLFAR